MATLPCFELYVDMLACHTESLLLTVLGLLHRLSARQNTHETFWDCDTATHLVQLLRSDSREVAKLCAAQVLQRLCADPDLHSRLVTTDVVPAVITLLRRAADAPDGAERGGSLVLSLLTALQELLTHATARAQVWLICNTRTCVLCSYAQMHVCCAASSFLVRADGREPPPGPTSVMALAGDKAGPPHEPNLQAGVSTPLAFAAGPGANGEQHPGKPGVWGHTRPCSR
jgi:hypothetical protein